MKTIAEYLEKALQFEQLANLENDQERKASLLEQAGAYRKLADERAKRQNIVLPSKSD
jgi:hypothetical protein